MMEDLAMYILELMMNSIAAKAKKIMLLITDSRSENKITIQVSDNGKGMSKEFLEKLDSPFTTTRKTRKIGLGVPFMKALTEQCDGTFDKQSQLGRGTTITASMRKDCIDTPEFGNIGEMLMDCIQSAADIRFEMVFRTDRSEFHFDTDKIKTELQEVPINQPEILLWIRDYINENILLIKETNHEVSR